ncbi:MAG: hypothetical protein KBC17_02485 [Candidatus Pacebacteria bacterium]|nr:hypothetical protein [Candidatus Paceibacterota bacterium]
MKIKITLFSTLIVLSVFIYTSMFSAANYAHAVTEPPFTSDTGGGNGGTTGNGTSSKNIHINYVNPISVDTIDGFIATAIDALVMLLTPLVVIMIVWTGFLFIKAQGNVEALGVAKKALLYTVIGAIIVLIAKGFSLAIKSVFSEF